MKSRLFSFIERLQYAAVIVKIAWKFYPNHRAGVQEIVNYHYRELYSPVAAHMLDQWNLIQKSESMSSKREYHKITQIFYGNF